MKKNISFLFLISSFFLLQGCSSLLENKETIYKHNACKMLKENDDWLDSLYQSYKKWKVPMSVQLAFIRQESSFRYNARPLKEEGFFWNDYYSTAYGFSQALDGTWSDYVKETGNDGYRTSFEDSTDFIGWYLNKTSKTLRLSRNDTYSLYLAYHEGNGGFKNKTYNKKPWLKKAAWKVDGWAKKYSRQLVSCDF